MKEKGLVVIFKLPAIIAISIVIFCSILNYASRAIYDVLIKRYLGNFSDNDLLPKIYSANSLGKNLIRSIIGIVGSFVIGIISSAYFATIIMGSIFVILMMLVLAYMKSRVGLELKQYKEERKVV